MQDWLALLLASYVAALAMVGELKDIVLCTAATVQAWERIEPGWRYSLLFLGGMRRWLFLPILISAIPMLVMFKGGDALSVCFNTVRLSRSCNRLIRNRSTIDVLVVVLESSGGNLVSL